MVLKPFPRQLVDGSGRVDDTRLLPHWLPMPPHPSTHQARHLRLPCKTSPASANDASSSDGGVRWEPLEVPLPVPAKDTEARPILRVFVMSTKRRIHKRAVIRHRVRTKLVAALRTAIFRLQDSKLDVERMLDPRRKVVTLIAQPTVYLKDMEALVGEMDKALRRITNPSPRHSVSPSKYPRKTTFRHASKAT